MYFASFIRAFIAVLDSDKIVIALLSALYCSDVSQVACDEDVILAFIISLNSLHKYPFKLPFCVYVDSRSCVPHSLAHQ